MHVIINYNQTLLSKYSLAMGDITAKVCGNKEGRLDPLWGLIHWSETEAAAPEAAEVVVSSPESKDIAAAVELIRLGSIMIFARPFRRFRQPPKH